MNEPQEALLSSSLFCSLYVTASIAALSLLKAHATRQTLVADITQTWANMVDERKWRKDVCEALIRSGLLSIAEFDMQVFKRLTAKQSFPNAVECALHMASLSDNPSSSVMLGSPRCYCRVGLRLQGPSDPLFLQECVLATLNNSGLISLSLVVNRVSRESLWVNLYHGADSEPCTCVRAYCYWS